ncbi:16883_t:CDS:2, partial [Racocetra persica]
DLLKYDTFPEDKATEILRQLQEQSNDWDIQHVRIYWNNNRHNKRKKVSSNVFDYVPEEYEKDTSLVVKSENAIAETADKESHKRHNVVYELNSLTQKEGLTKNNSLQESQIESNNVSTGQLDEQTGAKRQCRIINDNEKKLLESIFKYDTFPEDEVIEISRQLQEQSNYWNMQHVRAYWDNNRYNKKKVYPDIAGYKELGNLLNDDKWGYKEDGSGTIAYVLMENKTGTYQMNFTWKEHVYKKHHYPLLCGLMMCSFQIDIQDFVSE